MFAAAQMIMDNENLSMDKLTVLCNLFIRLLMAEVYCLTPSEALLCFCKC